jgi:hypothetical protein
MVTGALMQTIEAAAVAGAIEIPGPPPTATSGIHSHLLGEEVYLLFDLDEREHQRRRACGLTAIDDRESLHLLSSLPQGEAVQVADLGDAERGRIRRLPPGAAEVSGGLVTRLAVPPVTLRLAIVADDDAGRGLDRASRFAPFSSRLLVLTEATDNLPKVEVEARFYGIGLVAMANADVVVLVNPAPPKRTVGPVSWRVREQAYAAYCAAVVN